tara:strand:- start:40 stop:708 length:669 start_codon:yes stop_codon:yes gene_type:complete
LPRKVSVTQKKEILEKYQKGSSIKDLSLYFNFSKQTITKQLKTLMGEEEFRKFKYLKVDKTKRLEKKSLNLNHSNTLENSKKSIINNQSLKNVSESTYDNSENFFEIPPLIENIDLEKQKDISSRPISEFVFPKIVYLLVDKNIELETKYLRDFPEWQFLSSDELNRKTIQIFTDLKIAKRFCNREQKIIKVPNTTVFELAAPILKSRGISRIVNDDSLIAL